MDTGVANLRLVTSGPVPNHPAELLGGRSMAALIESLRSVADITIVDTPPVLAVADASILAPLTDATMLVVDPKFAGRSALEHTRIQLDIAGAVDRGGLQQLRSE
jgi:protein-tyrosine kinase